MGLNEIKTLDELLCFLPLLAKVHHDVGKTWTNNMSVAEFISEVTNKFGNGSRYFGIKNGDILYYFIAVQKVSETKIIFWSFYMCKERAYCTKNLLSALRAEYKQLGFVTAEFSTNRITRSYHRWVSSFGAVRAHITYKLKL